MISMKGIVMPNRYQVTKSNQKTKYEKQVVKAKIWFDVHGEPIPKNKNPRRVLIGSFDDFKYSPSGNIRTPSAIVKAIHDKIDDLEDAVSVDYEPKKILTIQKVFDQFLDHYRTTKSKKTLEVPKKSTVKKMKLSFLKYINVYGNHPANKFQPKHKEQLMLSGKINLSRRALISYISEINFFLAWAYEYGHTKELMKLDKPQKTKKDYSVKKFTGADQDKIEKYILFKFKSALGGHKKAYENWYRAFFLFRYRGLRAGDLFRLKTEDINLEQNRIILKPVNEKTVNKFGKVRVIEGTTKSRAIESVPLTSNLKEYLVKDLEERNPEEIWWLDRGNGNHQFSSPDAITNAFSKILKACGLYGVAKPTHGHRSALGTKLVNINPALAQMALRHQDIRTTIDHYYDQDDDALVDALEKIDF